jgi:hypothetical protein
MTVNELSIKHNYMIVLNVLFIFNLIINIINLVYIYHAK